jgi:hypothetical protein
MSAHTPHKIIDHTEKVAESRAKSTKTTKTFLVTTTWLRSIRKVTPSGPEYVDDYGAYRAHVESRLNEFYDQHVSNTFQTRHPELVKPGAFTVKPETHLEINSYGYLHAHTFIELTYDRIVDENDPKKRLKDVIIDWREFNRLFRDVVEMGSVSTKIDIKNVDSSIENVKKYLMKHE